jgi:hypothetical protein
MWTRPAPWDVRFTSGWRQRSERIEPRTYFAAASVDVTEARYGRTLNKNQTTANQCVGALLTGRGDWTATELLLAGVQG